MNEAIVRMLSRYRRRHTEDVVNALREILQEVALLGLWRAKFFEKGAFYGGTALRILYGLDRFSEGLDFSLLRPDKDFNLTRYGNALIKEMEGFGYNGPQNLDSVISYTWEIKGGGPSGTNAKEVSAFI